MKCHICGQHQADSNTSCAACGASFSCNGAETSKLVVYDEVPSRMKVNMMIAAGLVAFVCLIGRPIFFGAGSSALPKEVVRAQNEKSEHGNWNRARETKQLLGQMCFENLLQMGASELTARAECFNDADAKKELEQSYDREAMIRNIVPADKISRIELLIFDQDTDASASEQPFSLRLRLYDEEGKPASSDGELTFTFSPEEPIFGGIRRTSIHGNSAKIAHITSEDLYLPIYEFTGFRVIREHLDGASEIQMTVTFGHSLDATASYSVTYVGE